MSITLFLDIDGVLNNTESLKRFGQIADFHSAINEHRNFEKSRINFDDNCVDLVKSLQIKYQLDVVICSMWRFGATINHFIELFKCYDWIVDTVDLIDTTIVETVDFNRSKIIQKYIVEHNINKFIIFDDVASYYDRFFDNLIITDGTLGFTNNDKIKAETILNTYLI